MTAAVLGGALLVLLAIWCWGDFHTTRVALVAVVLGAIIAGTNGWAHNLVHFLIQALTAVGGFIIGFFQ